MCLAQGIAGPNHAQHGQLVNFGWFASVAAAEDALEDAEAAGELQPGTGVVLPLCPNPQGHAAQSIMEVLRLLKAAALWEDGEDDPEGNAAWWLCGGLSIAAGESGVCSASRFWQALIDLCQELPPSVEAVETLSAARRGQGNTSYLVQQYEGVREDALRAWAAAGQLGQFKVQLAAAMRRHIDAARRKCQGHPGGRKAELEALVAAVNEHFPEEEAALLGVPVEACRVGGGPQPGCEWLSKMCPVMQPSHVVYVHLMHCCSLAVAESQPYGCPAG